MNLFCVGISHHTADVQVRNRGTVAGSVAHADPAGDWPAALMALDTDVMLTGLKRRPGDTVHVSLTFAHAGNRLLVVPILAPGDEPGAHQHE